MATITAVAAARGGQQRSLPLPDDPTPQQLRDWVIQRGSPGGGGFDFMWPQRPRDCASQRCVPGRVEGADLGSSESAAAPGAGESAVALGVRASADDLGASASTATGPTSTEALHTFMLDSGASRCFFRDCTTVTPLAAPVPVALADPTRGPVVARASTVLPCPAVSLVRDAKASKLSSRTLRCVFLGFPTDALPWHFYHQRELRVFSSHDVTFDESVCFYRLHPHASHSVLLAPLFLVPVPPLVGPLPPQGLAPSGVSQVDPPPLVEPLEISSDTSGLAKGGDPAADDTTATRRSPRLETPPGFPPRPSLPPPQPVAVDCGAEIAGAEPGGAETEGEGFWGAATGGAGPGGAATGGADSGGAASPSGGGAVGDPAGGPRAGQPSLPYLLETLSPQAICAWIVRLKSRVT
ncbi:unnamed protein product [Closterium sp. NIES-53]